MMNQGIDQQIQQKVDAYRGKPEALQQRYAQNKQLIDLLALQKLKSEKDAVARNMQMQMQQQPSTIKDQLETEMVQRTKDDMAKQLGGIMQKRQADQKKRASQMGIAANPAPNMQQMASGGIVGFAGPQGSQVQGELTEKELKVLGYSKADFEALPDNIKAQILQKISKQREYLSEQVEDTPSNIPLLSSRKTLETEMERRKKVGDTFVPDARTDYSLEETIAPRDVDDLLSQPQTQPQTRPPVPTEDETDYLDPQVPAEPSTPAPKTTPTPDQGGIAAIAGRQTPQVNVPAASSQFEVKPQTADYTEADKLSQGLEDAFRKDSQLDPTAAQDAEYKKALSRIGYSADEKALRQKRIDQLQALYDKRMDPDKLRQEEARAFLAAGSQGTGGGIGTVLGRASRGAAAARAQADKASEGQINKLMGVETDLMKEGSAQRTAAYDAGLKLGQQVRTQRGEGLKGIAGLSEGQARRAEEEAKRLSDANIATLEGRDRQRAMELKAVIATMDAQYKNDALKLEAMLGTSKNDVLKAYNEAKTVSDIQQVESQVLSEIAKSTAAFTEYFGDKIENAQLVGDEATQKGTIKALQQQQANAIEASTRELRTLLTELRQRRTGFGAAQPTGQ